MAAANPRQLTDPFGDTVTFWTDLLVIYMQRNAETPIDCFHQTVSNSPVAPSLDRTGRLYCTYLDGAGARHTQYSDRDGDSGTWTAL